jgi:hypothetical protein
MAVPPPRLFSRPVGVFLLAALGLVACRAERPRNPLPLPALMLWAWERPEDFGFLAERAAGEPGDVGVAYLQATILLRRGGLQLVRRRSALRIPPPVVRLPVVRVEAAADAVLDDHQRAELTAALLEQAAAADLGRLQVDFEALASQRSFYRGILAALRAKLPAGYPLSITALGSWCLSDRWLARLPVDEIVPMFYRLGREGPALRAALGRGTDLAPECRAAHGLSIDEPMVLPPSPRRLYLFSPTSWHNASFAAALARLRPSKE